MSAAWRIALSSVPLVVSIVLGWNMLTDGMASGTHYLVLGSYASLMGLVSIGMVSWVPMLGAIASLVVATLLRLRPPAAVSEMKRGWLLVFFGPGIFLASSWCAWKFMWWSQTPVATEFARYDSAYFWITALMIGSLAIGAGGFSSWVVLRGAVLTDVAKWRIHGGP